MIQITIGNLPTFQAESLDALTEEQGRTLSKAYATGTPVAIVPCDPFPVATASTAATSDDGDVIDAAAKARIDAQHAILQANGIDVAKAAKDAHQVAPNGTKMWGIGYSTQAARKAEHDRKLALTDVAHEIETRVSSEHRTDVAMSAADLAAALTVNGKIHVAGKALTEQAIRGLASRLESPMLGYVLGLRDRIGAMSAARDNAGNVQPLVARVQRDRDMIADIIRHECRVSPETKIVLRTRNGDVNDIYAIVSPSYEPADAPHILPEILATLPKETRATFAYDPTSTQWEIRASVWTPTPVDQQAIGEAFEGYVSLRSRDNGTSRFRGDGGVTLIRCYNATTYNAGGATVARVHRGTVARDVALMVREASRSIHVLCQAWGMAREAVIPMTAEEKAMGDAFLHSLWIDALRKRPLEGVLTGRKADHASGLVSAYHAERRDPARFVKADMAQAWTRYIQDQPSDVRRDAEAAIGSWVVGGRS